jgi:hypothetical protein
MDDEPPKSWQDYQIAWAFTLFYWLVAIAWALRLNDPIVWLFALFLAVPPTVIVWLTALFSNYMETPLSPTEFAKVTAGLTIVYATLLVFWLV